MKNNINFIYAPPFMPDEVTNKKHCLCYSCKHGEICKYKSKFIEFQHEHFPAKIDCYEYKKGGEQND